MTRLLALATALLLAAATPAQPVGDEESLRQAFLSAFNRERAEARAPALALSRRLSTAAQQHADEIARRGNLRTGPGDQERMDERLHKEDYRSQRWTESVISSTEEIGSVVRFWKRESGDLYRQVMEPDFREIGIGISELDGVPVYTFLFAVPEEAYYESRTADLKDLRAVRQAILAKTNAQRARGGARPLVANSLLERAAQGHAEDMLRRGYFAHASPDGKTVRQRTQAVGYQWQTIGENIAEGQLSVDEVMAAWMKSPEHRENILNRSFQELGVGLAMGESAQGYRVVWVQNFGHPR